MWIRWIRSRIRNTGSYNRIHEAEAKSGCGLAKLIVRGTAVRQSRVRFPPPPFALHPRKRSAASPAQMSLLSAGGNTLA
jgi:hypothetical protein